MTLPYAHLSLAERREIARMHATKIPVRVMSEHLQRHPSTLYREIKRNWVHDEEPLYRGYYPVAADMQARARRQRLSKLARKPVLATYVMDRLKAGWPPDQIAGRLRTTGAPERLSHETIYRFVYGSQGQKLGLYQDLPMARRRRRVRYQRTPRGLFIRAGNTIEQRPAEIAERTSFGHWEGDLTMFHKELGKHNLTSLIERQSRYAILTRNRDRNSTGVMNGMIEKLKVLPETARLSITFDRGTSSSLSRAPPLVAHEIWLTAVEWRIVLAAVSAFVLNLKEAIEDLEESEDAFAAATLATTLTAFRVSIRTASSLRRVVRQSLGRQNRGLAITKPDRGIDRRLTVRHVVLPALPSMLEAAASRATHFSEPGPAAVFHALAEKVRLILHTAD